jgi:hypothetical protein
LRGLFLGSIRDDDAAGGFLLGFDALDNNAVVQRTERMVSSYATKLCCFSMGWPLGEEFALRGGEF